MRSFKSKPIKVALAMTLVISLTGCTTSTRAPVNFRQLGQVLDPLPGAQGKTRSDQRKIDETVAAGCSGKIISKEKCDAHTKASAARKQEL